MDYIDEYKNFIEWISDPGVAGKMGPVKYNREEEVFGQLFAAYLNCRYPPADTMIKGGK